MSIEPHTGQKTLGLVGTGLVTVMQNQIWQGAIKAAQGRGVRLVYFPVISLSSTPPFNPNTKILFDFLDTRYLDGLIIWYGGIAEGIGLEQGNSLFDPYQEVPVVTIGGKLETWPDLSIDNYHGTRLSVEHFVKKHHRKHIAILRGPRGHPDADERYRGYVDGLQAQNLSVDPDHVAETLFELKTASEDTEKAISQWIQNAENKPIDAVIASSDYMALAAVQAIKACGLRVPEDISVIGFDDIDDSQANIPSITTVHQPFYEMGYQAVEMLLALIEGRTLPAETIIPAQLMVRESCGCVGQVLSLANEAGDGETNTAQETGVPAVEFAVIARRLHIPLEHVEELAALLQSDLRSGNTQYFLVALKRDLVEATNSFFNIIDWQNAIATFQKYTVSSLDEAPGPWGEVLFRQASMLVAEIGQRAAIRQRLKTEQQAEILRRTSEAVIASFREQDLLDAIGEYLPQVGFRSFYLSRYEDPAQPELWSHLLLAYENGIRHDLPPGGLRYPTVQLVPVDALFTRCAAFLVVEPLYFGDEQLGFLVLEAGPVDGTIYESLRAQISSALQGSRLLQQVQQYTNQLEQRVAERTTELTRTVHLLESEVSQRLKAEQAIRQMNEVLEQRVAERTQQLEESNRELEAFSYSISHDLHAPLRAIRGFSNALVEDFRDALPEEALHYLDRIQSNTKRMGNLIDDLLAFSQSGRKALQVDDVEMNQLIQEVLDELRFDDVLKKSDIIIEELPSCKSDRSLLKVVWTNLITNAIKYSSKRENPHIEIRHTLLEKDVVFLIKDNGVGFDMQYADKVFGVFQRLHSLNEYEGTGIGLAMVRRIITRLNGKIWVEAEVDQGATFYFTLGKIS